MKPAATGRTAEYLGHNDFASAIERILIDDEVDVVVVRDVVPRAVIATLARIDDPACVSLQLPDVKPFIEEWWTEHGYTDYGLTNDPSYLPEIRRGGINPHVDRLFTTRQLIGPYTLSLCVSGSSIFYAEKPVKTARHPNGMYNPKVVSRWTVETQSRSTDQFPRSAVSQNAGDAVLISNHPRPAWHAVVAEDNRTALLYDSYVNIK